ncbi:phosphatase PAP2 family protein [Geobacter benzoatilyticus]|uniref:Phosphatase PAP2 family protein n=1 Tax=Geobacter benzoatilyticus TaxID=2815309 RepID=A0ABX7Q7R3_9BACT|nr:phosphatase PAP2 family protein [Geobacter benzoatilyticus]QSV47237.1 phosphatase PAP2 family protein [Geobacter benzoatilyticus]
MKNCPPAPLDTHFWFRHGAVPFLLFILVATACEITHLDLVLADRFYDFTAGNWPARRSWWAEWLIHKRGRDLVAVVASLSFISWVLSYQVARLRTFRWNALYLLVAIVLGTGIVTIGKDLTGRHCPWSMERYGGTVPYTRLFEGNPPGAKKGKCFPAGHAAGGFSLMGVYFALRDRRAGIARAGLITGLVLGTVYGYAQMARGAHFLSHTVWSAAICWFVALGLYLVFRPKLKTPTGEFPS